MDKLKPIFKMIQKYHVWVLCVVIIVTAVGGLFAASGGLSKNTNTTKSKVTSLNSRVTKLASPATPPHNQAWIDQKNQETEAERNRIRRIWERIYDRQQKYLQWPEAVGGLAFATKLEEQKAKSRLEKPEEEQFEKYTAAAFDHLLSIVQAEPNYATHEESTEKKGAATGNKPKRAASLPPVRAGFVVGWAPASQKQISKPLLRWGNEDPKTGYGAPTANRAEQTQRNLWIYESMLKAIAATNDGATANYMARVKYIRKLQIGRDVQPLFVAAPEKTPELPTPGKNNKSAARKNVARPAPRPILSSTFSGIETVPVRMDLIVDQRYLSRLFAECANAPLPIEITGFTAHYRSRSNKDHFDPQKVARESRLPGQVERKQDGPVSTIVDTYDMDVSIEGNVHFYKPPDDALLGLNKQS